MTALAVVKKQEPGELSAAEATELDHLEGVIEKNLRGFYEVGTALIKIRDGRLYRSSHDTFEDYCRDRWDMGRNYMNKLIASASVVDSLGTMVPILPTNERQARPLTKLETPEQQREVWEMVIETAPDGKVTARHVAGVVALTIAEIKEDKIKKKHGQITKTINEDVVDSDFKNAFDLLYVEIKRLRADNFKTTTRLAASRLVELALDLIHVD